MKPFLYLFSLLMLIALAGCNLGFQPATDKDTFTVAEATEEPPIVVTEEATVEALPDETTGDVAGGGASDDAAPQPNVVQPAQLPPRTDTITYTSCSPRTDWPVYAVVAGDTLYSIAQRSGTNVATLADANCLSDVNALSVGQALYVPRYPDVVNDQAAACIITITQRTPVIDSPSGTGRTTLGYLAAGSIVLPVLHFDGLPYWGVMFNGDLGWIDVQPTGDCSTVARNAADMNIPTNDNTGTQGISGCQFVAVSSAPIYRQPNVRAPIIRNTIAGEGFRFERFSGTWEEWNANGEIITGRWVSVSIINASSGYIQAETGRLEGNCPA